MADVSVSGGFEGFEKRLELHFTGDDPALLRTGLRRLDFDSLQQVLRAVQCTIVSAVGNTYFDSYVLSESSLFVYPTKIIIKTCGTTQLLKSIPPLIRFAGENLGFVLASCRYSRGSFIFPLSQPFPHTSFDEEVLFLEQTLPPDLTYKKAALMPSKTASHSWHVFCACHESVLIVSDDDDDEYLMYTVEVCMTELDTVSAQKFFQPASGGNSGDISGKKMTAITGINEINPDALICDFGFDPCGYSMNGIDGDRYSTIHVTPENGYSYASFECVGSVYDDEDDIVRSLKKAIMVFRPGKLSVSVTCNVNKEIWTRIARALMPLGLKCRSYAVDEFPAFGNVVYQTFSTCRKKNAGF